MLKISLISRPRFLGGYKTNEKEAWMYLVIKKKVFLKAIVTDIFEFRCRKKRTAILINVYQRVSGNTRIRNK